MKCPMCKRVMVKNDTDIVGVLEYGCSNVKCRLICVRLRPKKGNHKITFRLNTKL